MSVASAPSPLQLHSPVTMLRNVGTRGAVRLAKLGITTVRQLLWHLPSRYEDYSQSVPIADVVVGEKQSIRGRVTAISSRAIWPKRMTVTTATITDDSGSIRAVWFNQPYLQDSLPEGVLISMAGKVTLDKRGLHLSNPVYEKVFDEEVVEPTQLRHTGRLVPVYPETDGMTSKYLRFLIQPLLEYIELADPLPVAIRKKYALMGLADAVRAIHYPATPEAVEPAKMRLAFDDLLLFQLKALYDRRQQNQYRSPQIPLDVAFMKQAVATLPYPLTRDQRVAATEILRDMERAFPMNRLLEGDVGSGKTVVALLAALHVAHVGGQTVLIAPTEVLAQQHYRTLRGLCGDVSTALLTGSRAFLNEREVKKPMAHRAIATGAASIIIGTHAVLETAVRWHKLVLVVIDEQHRFGITQRAALVKADRHDGVVPHLLSMTATPIPRTLALTIFGDLDISIIREKPKGRQPIATKVITTADRAEMEQLIRSEVKSGRQVFVICPIIETAMPADATKGAKGTQAKMTVLWAQVKAVQDEAKRLAKEVFPELRVALLYGRMKPKEKEQVMREFKDGWHDILVATSVIEVGVDVPNATIMLIEGADRFGLAQLHQFRGRVGRGAHQSYCFLVPSDDGAARQRLAVLAKTDDGFALAEHDMRFRGPGEFFGIKQSGLPDLTMAALANVELIQQSRVAARALMKTDPELRRTPLLRDQLEAFRKLSHFE